MVWDFKRGGKATELEMVKQMFGKEMLAVPCPRGHSVDSDL